MKYIITSAYILLFTLNINAQDVKKGFLIGINGSANKSNLYNKWDSRANEEGKELHYIKSYGNCYGVELGYFWGKGFNIFINPTITNVEQKYQGSSTRFVAGDVKSNMNTQLTYLQTSLKLQKLFGKRKIKFLAEGGISLWKLKKYSDYFEYNYYNPASAFQPFQLITSIENEEIRRVDTRFSADGKTSLNRGIYNKTQFGLEFGTGVDYQIFKNLHAFSKITASYTLGDIEYKDTIQIINPKGPLAWPYPGSYLPFINTVKHTDYTQTYADKRTAAHIFNLGLTIGIRFIIPQ